MAGVVQLSNLSNEIFNQIAKHGYTALLIFLAIEESGIPMPIPGDLILLYAGVLISRSRLAWLPTMVYSLAGVVMGASLLFGLFKRGGRPFAYRYGKYILLTKARLHWLEKFFAKYGKLAIVAGRFTPGLRVFISAISGLAGTVKYEDFVIQVSLAGTAWIGLMLGIGYYLGERHLKLIKTIEGYSYLIFGLFLLIIVAEIVRISRREAKEKKENSIQLKHG
jgi:membrane protein DedA with SNARE-associated domain